MSEASVRLADLMRALSLAVDLGPGIPMQAMQKTALIAAPQRARAGRQLDLVLVVLLTGNEDEFATGLDAGDLTARVLAAEPGAPRVLSGPALDRALSAFADFGDFRSPHMPGHFRRAGRSRHARRQPARGRCRAAAPGRVRA